MKELRTDVLVVGGGVAGIMAALWAQSLDKKVTLIERADSCGGLLRSTEDGHGNSFDYGTHIPAKTGNEIVDNLLFGVGVDVDWIHINKLRKGNFFYNKLNTSSQFIDITNLPQCNYQVALSQLVNSLTTADNSKNLEDSLRLHYGQFLTDEIFTPLLQKIYQSSFDKLSPGAHRFMEYTRVVMANSEVSKELKKSAIYDSKFAYAHYLDGGTNATHLYPRKGGCGAWINALIKNFSKQQGCLMTGMRVAELNPESSSLILNDGSRIFYRHLVWTGPIGLLAKLISPQIQVTMPTFIPTKLYHLILSNKPLCDCHYVYINDPEMRSFRVTLYPNITNNCDDFRVTVEAVNHDNTDNNVVILDELIRAGLFSSSTIIVSEYSELLPNGFPELTLKNIKENAEARRLISSYDNILTGGRGASDNFFMNDVLKAAASELEIMLGLPSLS